MSIVDRFLTATIKYLQKTKKDFKKKSSKSVKRLIRREETKKPIVVKKKKISNIAKKKTAKKKAVEKKAAKKKAAKKVVSKKIVLKKAAPSKKKKIAAKKVSKKEPTVKKVLVGMITHFFPRIEVVVVQVVKGPLCVGDKVQVEGATSFMQEIKSLQVESVDVKSARKGQLVGLKVDKSPKVGDKIYKLG